MAMHSTAGAASLLDDVEWWDIERRTRRGQTTYGISIFGERIVSGQRSVIAAINAALEVLHEREGVLQPA